MTELLQRALQPSLKMESKSLKFPYELLAMETALLVATAASREIDVSLWFGVGDKAGDGRIPVREFDAKIISLASAMGINQDAETKRELELATSALALRAVHTVCAAGEDELGQLLLDARLFFRLCHEKVDKYLLEVDQEQASPMRNNNNSNNNNNEDFRHWEEGEYDIHGNAISLPSAPRARESERERERESEDVHAVEDEHSQISALSHDASDEDNDDIARLSAEDYIQNLRAKSTLSRPQSAPAGARAQSRGETAVDVFAADTEPVTSRYEVHSFSEEDSHSDGEAQYAQHRGSMGFTASASQRETRAAAPPVVDWDAENRAFLQLTSHMPSKAELKSKESAQSLSAPATSTARPRPSSAPRAGRAAADANKPATLRSRSAEKTRTSVTRKSVSSSAALPLTQDQLHRVKEVVEDLLRDTVKKTDCYHLVQVHLGYVDAYTMVPPRGAIVQSRRTEWVSDRQIHGAFIAGRLFLNDNQIKALKHLVADFAKQYRTLYRERADELIKLDESLEDKTPSHVFGPHHSLSSEWLRRYLLHLRLTKRAVPSSSASLTAQQLKALNTSSIASKSVGLPAGGAGTAASDDESGERHNKEKEKTPKLWKEWLGQKLKQEMEKGPQKPKDLEKALNGQNHALSKEDVEYLLKTHRILPQEALSQEIEFRIESWVLDTDGRRDFQHQLNVKIRTWIWEEMVQTKAAKLPRDEQGYWRIWQKLPKEKRSEVKEGIIKKLVDDKREELRSSERTKQDITKSLYWQFDASRREREIAWTEWLPNHFDKLRRNLDKFKKDEEERLKIASKQKQRRKSMASLQAIESTLKDVAKNLDSHHQMQLQKGIVSLRRAAQQNGLGKGGVITKEEFDTHIRKIISRFVPLDETFLENHAMDPSAEPAGLSKMSEELRQRIKSLFTADPKETLQRVTVDQDQQSSKQKVSFESWLAEKKRLKQEQERKEIEKKEKEEREKQLRLKKSEKAYKKWVKLRKNNKYKSMVDKKSHPVPTVRKADHTGRWNYDKEISRPPDIDNSDEVVPRQVSFKPTKSSV